MNRHNEMATDGDQHLTEPDNCIRPKACEKNLATETRWALPTTLSPICPASYSLRRDPTSRHMYKLVDHPQKSDGLRNFYDLYRQFYRDKLIPTRNKTPVRRRNSPALLAYSLHEGQNKVQSTTPAIYPAMPE